MNRGGVDDTAGDGSTSADLNDEAPLPERLAAEHESDAPRVLPLVGDGVVVGPAAPALPRRRQLHEAPGDGGQGEDEDGARPRREAARHHCSRQGRQRH